MDRKSKCEKVVLTKSEKKLLCFINRHPHTKCSREEIQALHAMGLVCQDRGGADENKDPILLDTYCVTEFYRVYRDYRSEQWFELTLSSLWLPIVVSILTNLTTDGIQALLPLIQQWFASSL